MKCDLEAIDGRSRAAWGGPAGLGESEGSAGEAAPVDANEPVRKGARPVAATGVIGATRKETGPDRSRDRLVFESQANRDAA